MKDLHAVVTGGGSGIGAAIARQLRKAGARVTLMGRNVERLKATGLPYQPADVGDEASVRAAFTACGPVDILVNNAGQVETAKATATSLELWQRMLQVNLTGTFLCSREVLDGMAKRGFGRVINVASTAGLTGYAYVAAYCAAKHGVVGLTKALALEYAKKGVTVNAVCPGYTETDIIERSVQTLVAKTGRSADEAKAEFARSNPQGRLVQPDEVASTVLWLAGAGAVNGQSISVCGGEILR
ncbi:SDR family NAD(P)-dependent oxidoreductase [Pelomonas sp. KK5]|uniref:SDR family NAD(P)-dependent oxidoreductase n=1 Tax=Pelomonas sp. KK5 TaxID=1855730 RepID=UPI00097BF03F|nr:SDR family NAD(P)-dependent oxidoreductase [Pelomonas sp. KK5]